MDPPTAEEPLGIRAESRCGWVGQRDLERWACESMSSEISARLEASQDPDPSRREGERSGTQSGDGKGRGERGRRMEDKQQDACLAALRGHLHVQLDTEGIVSLFVSLTQYKQITHGPMEPAKHTVQCIQKHVSYKEHIHHIIYTAYSTKQLSANARLGVQSAADLGGRAAVGTRPALTRFKGGGSVLSHSGLYSWAGTTALQRWKPEIQECFPRSCRGENGSFDSE